MGKEKVKCTVEFSPKLFPHSPYIFHISLLMLIIEMPGKSPALFLSQIIDLESNEIPSLPWCYSAVPFISSGLGWHSASMLSSAANSRGEMSWRTSKSLKTERFGWYARETPRDWERGSLGFLRWIDSRRPSVSLFLDLNLPRYFQAVPIETSAFCLLLFNLNLANLIQWLDVCLGNIHLTYEQVGRICVDYVGSYGTDNLEFFKRKKERCI